MSMLNATHPNKINLHPKQAIVRSTLRKGNLLAFVLAFASGRMTGSYHVADNDACQRDDGAATNTLDGYE